MHVQVATPAGSNVNTELPHKVQKCTDMARNTVNNKLTTSKHYKTSKSTQQRVSVKYNPPPPPPPPPPQGLGYTPMLALTEPPLGFESLAWPGFGLRPNPGENLATTFLRNRTDSCDLESSRHTGEVTGTTVLNGKLSLLSQSTFPRPIVPSTLTCV